MKETTNRTDEQLLKEYMHGSEQALGALITRHKSAVQRYIYRTTKSIDVSDDIFQDTFVKVINNLKRGKYKENGKFLPWVMRISHNLVIDHFRSQKKFQFSKDAYDFDILNHEDLKTAPKEANVVDDLSKKELSSLVARLPKEQREIVKMRYFWGLSFKEIAEHTDVSINTSLGRMRYALINLRKNMNNKR